MTKNSRSVFIQIPAMIFLLCGTVFIFSACAVRETAQNRENLEQVRIGMTKAEVLQTMGDPLWSENYSQENLWYYYTRTKWYDGMVTRDECTPFIFDESGKLMGFGTEYLNTHYRFGNWTQSGKNTDLPIDVWKAL